MTIAVMFHHSHFREFKHYCLLCIPSGWASYFRWLPSCSRFLELMKGIAFPLCIFVATTRLAECAGTSFIDSTTIDVCGIHREKQDKVFKGLAAKGKGAVGCFYGSSCIWWQQVAVRSPVLFLLLAMWMAATKKPLPSWQRKGLFGKLISGRGYISKKLVVKLLGEGIGLSAKYKKNMKKLPAKYEDAILLRKRAVIESVNSFLKNTCQIEQTRHRSPNNSW